MKSKRIAGALGIFGLLGLVSATAVADDKSFPGSVCFQTSSSGTFGRFAGSVLNSSSTSELVIQCPVVRDLPANTFGVNQVVFDVFDRNTGGIDVACNICNEVATSTGISTNCGLPDVTSGASAGVKQLFIDNPPANLGGTQYSYATCSLPRSNAAGVSHLARIWFNE